MCGSRHVHIAQSLHGIQEPGQLGGFPHLPPTGHGAIPYWCICTCIFSLHTRLQITFDLFINCALDRPASSYFLCKKHLVSYVHKDKQGAASTFRLCRARSYRKEQRHRTHSSSTCGCSRYSSRFGIRRSAVASTWRSNRAQKGSYYCTPLSKIGKARESYINIQNELVTVYQIVNYNTPHV